jgi:hypothetical protein
MRIIFVAGLVVALQCFESVLGDISGRGQCSTDVTSTVSAVSSRVPTSDAVVSANCAKLTIAAAASACAASLARPVLVTSAGGLNAGPVIPLTPGSPVVVLSGITLCTDPLPIVLATDTSIATTLAAALTFTVSDVCAALTNYTMCDVIH